MFGFFASQEKKMRDNARNWLELAEKVFHYRRDVLTDGQVSELQSRRTELQGLVKERAGPEKLKLGIERLEDVLRRTGGSIYPKTALMENIEFFLVAAIVILGIRTYFVQPFKIPTNSMWPTYNGMTPQVFESRAQEPGVVGMAARFLAFGASPKRVDAPADGEVFVPVGGASSALMVPFENVPGRKWLVIPTTLKEYTLFVDRTPVKLRVPADFDFEWAVRDAFFATDAPSRESAKSDLAQVALRRGVVRDERGQIYLATGKKVRTGERVMAFDILTGDNLFVDRVTYHFAQPEVGSGFVFRTGNIEGIRGISGDQYYIKRLVGVPGDKLQIKGTGLIRNGAPIEGSEAFAANAQQAGNYPGYRAAGRLEAGRILEIPPRSYFAMGDNSPNSADGREWGFVPAKDVVGRPLLVYYPFTRHWGPAR